MSLAGPSKDGEPTMKFVMDTSKYWFKPSITRDQGKKSGDFVARLIPLPNLPFCIVLGELLVSWGGRGPADVLCIT